MLARRLTTQRLTSTPFPDPADAVRLLTCVQAQDGPLARSALGLRARVDDAGVRAAIDAGRIVRTHILRPTWHFVAPEDLRWILRLTSAKVISAMAARHRQLGIEAELIDRSEDAVVEALRGTSMTRAEVGAAFAEWGLPARGEALGHVLMLAELRGSICSGPLHGAHHSYVLTDEAIPPTPELDRDEAVRALVHRFFAGHGPAAVTDLTRWTTLTQTEIKGALAELADVLEAVELDGRALWFDPSVTARARRAPERAWLLHTFDEVFLSYPTSGFPRAAAHPRGDQPVSFAEAGGGVIICDRTEVGWWRRVVRPGEVVVTVAVASSLDVDQRDAVRAAAERFAVFVGLPLRLHVEGG